MEPPDGPVRAHERAEAARRADGLRRLREQTQAQLAASAAQLAAAVAAMEGPEWAPYLAELAAALDELGPDALPGVAEALAAK